MSKTIDELLEELMDDVYHAIAGRIPYSEDHFVIASRTAIAGPWNAAVQVMKELVSNTLDTRYETTDWYCPMCHGSADFHPERHAPNKCSVAAAQAMIARMNGLTPTDDVV